jgi:hypothetical protein
VPVHDDGAVVDVVAVRVHRVGAVGAVVVEEDRAVVVRRAGGERLALGRRVGGLHGGGLGLARGGGVAGGVGGWEQAGLTRGWCMLSQRTNCSCPWSRCVGLQPRLWCKEIFNGDTESVGLRSGLVLEW